MQSLKIKTTLRILTTAFAVIPMLIVGISPRATNC